MSRGQPAFVLPSPWMVANSFAAFFYDPQLLWHLWATFFRVVASVAIATVVGGVLAIIPFYVPVTRDIVGKRIQPLLSAMPSLGWAILGVIWFGVSDHSVVFVQVAILVPFCFVNMSQGIDELDRDLLEMFRSYTRARLPLFVKLTLPSLVPYIVASVRMAYGVAWKIALIAELFGAETGLGYVMLQAQNISDVATVLATCLMIVFLFILGDSLVLRPIARRFAP
jgi:NitT/TauT family transport system permease protein/sulfonate transport system permease protein